MQNLLATLANATHGQRKRVMARLERIFFATGFVLLAVWGMGTLDGIVYSRAAIAKFDANNATKVGSSISVSNGLASGSEVGFALSPTKRVQQYKPGLLEKVDAPLAVLRIPKIHLEVPVFNGTDDLTLNRGVGRILGTAPVGAGGNLGIAGHRDGFFRDLKDVAKGDVIELARPGQIIDIYVIDRIQTTKPQDVSVLKSTSVPSLTLVTCFPFHYVGSAPKRYIVRASLWSYTPSIEGSSKDSISTGNRTNDKEHEK
jgi:sortase A